MLAVDWQLVLVALSVGGAGYVLVRRAWRVVRERSIQADAGCGSCGTCISNANGDAQAPGQPFVPLEVLRSRPANDPGYRA